MKPGILCLIIGFCLSPVSLMSHAKLRPYRSGTVISSDMPVDGLPITATDKPLVSKYAGLLKTDEDHIKKNFKLYSEIDYWMGTKYTRGGNSKKGGIDCSSLVKTLFESVYNMKIKPTSLTQFCDKEVALFTNRSKCQLGDLIFFKTEVNTENRNNRVTHVGFYLINGFFVQSSSDGVNIANLEKVYWKARVVAAGRLKESYYKKAGIAVPKGDIKDKTDLDVVEDSNFEPVPFLEDMEYIINEYSAMLNINKDDIRFPEVFDFIERIRYAPQSIINKCPQKLPGNNCLLSVLYKDVFDIVLDDPASPDFYKNNTFYQGDSKNVARFLDMVKIKSVNKKKTNIFSGIFLYSNYFLHIYKGEILISSLEDPLFKDFEFGFYRFKPEITKAVYSNIMDKRKGIKPGK